MLEGREGLGGGGWGGAEGVCNGKIECLRASTCVCVPVQMDAFQFELIKENK